MSKPTVRSAAEALDAGEVMIVPTDTVYGLAARPDRTGAMKEIFVLKGRPADKALPILGDSLGALLSVANFSADAVKLAERFWPGPLTLVLARAGSFTYDLGGPNDGTVAVRVPDHDLARSLLEATGPLAVTSANRSGDRPAETGTDAALLFPELLLLDGGLCNGAPSTVVDFGDIPQIVRQGPVTASDLGI